MSLAAQLVRWLHASLSKKTDGYMARHDTTIRAIFLLNNVNYLLKRLEKYDKRTRLGLISKQFAALVRLFWRSSNVVKQI